MIVSEKKKKMKSPVAIPFVSMDDVLLIYIFDYVAEKMTNIYIYLVAFENT